MWGIGITAVVGAVGSAASANSQSKAAQGAAAANERSAQATNDLNLRLFQESRGSTGSAILPTYLRDYEAQLGQGASRAALLGMANPEQRLADYQSAIDSLTPALTGSNATVNDLFSGTTLNNRLATLAPVAAARTAKAKTRMTSISQALDETIGRLNATMAKRGYAGGSSFGNRQLLGSTLATRQAAADAGADAVLTNAENEAALRDSDTMMRLQSVSLPYEQAQRRVSLMDLPIQAMNNRVSAAMQPLNFFRISPQAFQANPLPTVQPTLGSGAIVGNGVSAMASGLGGYFAQRGLMNQYAQMNGGTPTG